MSGSEDHGHIGTYSAVPPPGHCNVPTVRQGRIQDFFRIPHIFGGGASQSKWGLRLQKGPPLDMAPKRAICVSMGPLVSEVEDVAPSEGRMR